MNCSAEKRAPCRSTFQPVKCTRRSSASKVKIAGAELNYGWDELKIVFEKDNIKRIVSMNHLVYTDFKDYTDYADYNLSNLCN